MGWEKNNYLHPTRFVVLPNELHNPKFGRSGSGEERPVIIPSIYIYIRGTRYVVSEDGVASSRNICTSEVSEHCMYRLHRNKSGLRIVCTRSHGADLQDLNDRHFGSVVLQYTVVI